MLAAAFAADAQWTDSAPSFGSGVRAYARYYSAALTDFVVGDFMTEYVYPAALRQDPRYFRRGTGSGWARLGYAIGQIVWTHTDSGGTQFNFSEIAGNATAVAIGNAYYPDKRTVFKRRDEVESPDWRRCRREYPEGVCARSRPPVLTTPLSRIRPAIAGQANRDDPQRVPVAASSSPRIWSGRNRAG
jgi:hypothetical protein